MQIIAAPFDLQAQALSWRQGRQTIGFVPTMGYLHEGHLSLIAAARAKADKVIVSVFVNPTQFGPNEDFDAYPRDEARDTQLVQQAGADALFLPTPSSMYAPNAETWVEVPALARHLCGASRPTHFRGVCTVVAKLLNLAQPHFAFFGEKDWQQLAILRRMATDLMFPTQVIGCPIIRDDDGLAKSSRNVRLKPEERAQALALNHALSLAEKAAADGGYQAGAILDKMKVLIAEEAPLATVDYLAAVDPDTLEAKADLAPRTLFAIAARFSQVRLIDNRLIVL